MTKCKRPSNICMHLFNVQSRRDVCVQPLQNAKLGHSHEKCVQRANDRRASAVADEQCQSHPLSTQNGAKWPNELSPHPISPPVPHISHVRSGAVPLMNHPAVISVSAFTVHRAFLSRLFSALSRSTFV